MAFNDRRWERQHTRGWTAVVLQTDADWFRGYASDGAGARRTTAGTHFETIRDAADSAVLMRHAHDSRCPDWREMNDRDRVDKLVGDGGP